jgi:signal transduction histidine kinase
MTRTLLSCALALLLSACSAIGEIAYDSKIDRDKQACARETDSSAYRLCMERVRAIEKEAKKARKED